MQRTHHERGDQRPDQRQQVEAGGTPPRAVKHALQLRAWPHEEHGAACVQAEACAAVSCTSGAHRMHSEDVDEGPQPRYLQKQGAAGS